jgi:CMP-N,N'-diacetyllegionaminic acid synthase
MPHVPQDFDATDRPKILALVPARGGSKRLPGKNIRLLGGRPLVCWTIDVAVRSNVFCDILLSTDSYEIARIGADSGALVPWLRPAELSSDIATSVDVAIHSIEWYVSQFGAIDALMLLQPTSPFRSSQSIRNASNLFLEKERKPVVSVSRSASHPEWCFRQRADRLEPILGWEGLHARSQDLEPTYELNGAIYLIRPEDLVREHSFVYPGVRGFLMRDPVEALDIDTSSDWEHAEFLLTSGQVGGRRA